MTPAENCWTNICVLVVLVFVRDGLLELQTDMCRPAEENPAGLFLIGFLQIAPLTVLNNLKMILTIVPVAMSLLPKPVDCSNFQKRW